MYTKGEWAVKIRSAEIGDAEQLISLISDAETSGFMLFEPGERLLSAAGLGRRIEAMEQEVNSDILLVENEGELLGYLFIIGTGRPQCVYLAIGISEASRGRGVGTKLFERLDEWAAEKEIRRLELTVMVHNRAGLALYQKMGYKIEGIKKNSLKVNGKYIDEYYMAKLIG